MPRGRKPKNVDSDNQTSVNVIAVQKTPVFKVVLTLRRDGKTYWVNDIAPPLGDEEAEYLLKEGVIREKGENDN